MIKMLLKLRPEILSLILIMLLINIFFKDSLGLEVFLYIFMILRLLLPFCENNNKVKCSIKSFVSLATFSHSFKHVILSTGDNFTPDIVMKFQKNGEKQRILICIHTQVYYQHI